MKWSKKWSRNIIHRNSTITKDFSLITTNTNRINEATISLKVVICFSHLKDRIIKQIKLNHQLDRIILRDNGKFEKLKETKNI